MRVCMFTMLLPSHVLGGMEIHAMDLAKGIAKSGHEVIVITSRHPSGIMHESVDGVEIYYTDVDATSKKPLGRKALNKLEELHREKKFDVVHSQSTAAFYYVRDGIKKRLGVPLITTMHGTSLSEIRSIINQGFSLMLFPKILFHTFNHYYWTKEFIKESEAVIAISKELSEDIPKEFNIAKDTVKTIYNGIDTTVFRSYASKVMGEYPGERIILSVSVLHRQKGVQYLIEALAKLVDRIPNAHLIVVGDGPYRKSLEQRTIRLKLGKNVTFMGKVQHEGLADYYNACEAFIIPTIRVEGLPLIELEAMACGKPVIASEIGGIPSVITDGVNGLLVKPKDIDTLANRLIEVLENEKLARRLGSSARKTIEEGFSREKMVADTIKVYGGCIR
ncbi:MAG: glycosyltransferase family 4 protein [Candidatus Altiarchaeota archaeon]